MNANAPQFPTPPQLAPPQPPNHQQQQHLRHVHHHRFIPPASWPRAASPANSSTSDPFACPQPQLQSLPNHNQQPAGASNTRPRRRRRDRDSISVSDYYSEDTEPPPPSTAETPLPAVSQRVRISLASNKPAPLPPPLAMQTADDAASAAQHPDPDRSARYRKAIELIMQKCAALSADNQRLVHRVHYVKKITKRKERDVAILKRRLDVYNDGWRMAQPEPLFKVNMPTLIPANNNVIVRKKYKKREKPAPAAAAASQPAETAVVHSSQSQQQHRHQHPQPVQQHPQPLQLPPPPLLATDVIEIVPPPQQTHTITPAPHDVTGADVVIVVDSGSNGSDTPEQPHPQPHPQQQQQQLPSNISASTATTSAPKTIPKPAAAAAKEPKRKRARNETREKDPNAPKRPANPFFQFCQEQRSILMGELNSELLPGQPELSKQELTRQLANRWRALDLNGKQVYINMYECSKQKYNEEMQSYRIGGGGGGGGGGSR